MLARQKTGRAKRGDESAYFTSLQYPRVRGRRACGPRTPLLATTILVGGGVDFIESDFSQRNEEPQDDDTRMELRTMIDDYLPIFPSFCLVWRFGGGSG